MTPPVGAIATARASAADFTAEFAEEARRGLSQKPRRLPSRYLYDALGSALFDAICELPWYRVTRAEMRLLGGHAPEIWQAVSPLDRLIELGAGDGRKLAALLSGRPRTFTPLRVDLVDVSASALDAAARAAGAASGTRVVKHLATYEEGLQDASGPAPRGRALVLFLGSNIGNFDPPSADALLGAMARCLRPGDALLLGADLVKPERELLLAYDDPLGVTAAFNRNLLVRMNRELGAGFDPAAFAHRATWNARESRVEMHLVSQVRQRVRIPAARLDLDLRAGETIWTESSYKYRPVDVLRMVERAGLAVTRHWQDTEACFSLTLCELQAPAG
jgi:dimethylhistidine N-methyltransferase